MTTLLSAPSFAITGVGGVVAPRHLAAINEVGGRLVAAFDPNDSVGVLDNHAPDVPFFTEVERFDRYLEKLRHQHDEHKADYLTVCSPNYVHDAHCRLGLRLKADVICEKPVVINPWNIDPLRELEAETGHRIWTVLQLRTDPRILAMREELLGSSSTRRHDIVLTYITTRGRWYDVSWKGNVAQSGGISTNIGVHMFDLLIWLFGAPQECGLHLNEPRRMAGYLELERARVSWLLSVDAKDMPAAVAATAATSATSATSATAPARALRTITIDGSEIDFSAGHAGLHTRVYERTIAGEGFGLEDARPSIDLAHRVRHAAVESPVHLLHPLLRR